MLILQTDTTLSLLLLLSVPGEQTPTLFDGLYSELAQGNHTVLHCPHSQVAVLETFTWHSEATHPFICHLPGRRGH